ncbi:AAA family ATPase [Amphritea sp. 1_MG-2023]|uniref:ATP-dependent DNA helicase n=1 Tax=Amphritea sp. 1_MG-2023 TaxID=3062670 RepID=UPI0026E27F12|nr:AAA family ATPase [Amphritea sp. 1_MG-2023]MDO6562642.1 AAA family ATPase [Amphritea sp. 1_MG-2023]
MNTPIELNTDQQSAMAEIKPFLTNPSQQAFVLCGSAGTGKTTLVARILELAYSLELQSMLVAPTGRAARILQGKLDHMLPAQLKGIKVSTLHGAIYYQSKMTIDESRHEDGLSAMQMDFSLKKQGNAFDLLIVDEASMVGDAAMHQKTLRFGSSRLLTDLVGYVNFLYQEGMVSKPIKLLFVGDLAQLPPVGSEQSPALSPSYLDKHFGIQAQRYELTQVMRQAEGSHILPLANAIRKTIFQPIDQPLKIKYNETDVQQTDFYSAVKLIADNVRQNRSSVAVVYLNSIALEYNLGVRKLLWGNGYCITHDDDHLLVTRNSPSLGLSNGDLVKVHSVLTSQLIETVRLPNGHFVNLKFREVRLTPNTHGSDRDSETIQCTILENLLHSSNSDLKAEEQDALYELVKQRNPYLDPNSSAFEEAMRDDPYYNALQVRFGYALTCHKAQGGEWQEVIVDPMGVQLGSQQGKRWLYTAVTRASKSLLLVQ